MTRVWARATPAERAEMDALLSGAPHAEYRRRPYAWITEKLGARPETLDWSLDPAYRDHHWDGTRDPLIRLLDGIASGDDVGVEAATGTQKSHTAACLVLWFLACWDGARVFTFAPKEDQLRLFIWTEIGTLWPRFVVHFPLATLTDLCIRVRGGTDDSWGAWGYSVAVGADETVSTNAQGMHAAHMLLIYEEMPGIAKAVVEAGENTATAPHNIRLFLGNPDHQLDTLHVSCLQPGVRHIIISALDHPNVVTGRDVVPGAVSRKSVDRRRLRYGEESPFYLSRVRGISPGQSSDALIRLTWLEASATRWAVRRVMLEDRGAIGLDVAQSEHGDKASRAIGHGSRLASVTSFPCNDATALGTETAMLAKEMGIEPRHVGVDAIGVGAATVNELRRALGNITALQSGGAPYDNTQRGADGEGHEWMPDANEHRNLRGQMWWQLREDLRTGAVDLPPDAELFRQLTMVRWEAKGKVVWVEGKAEVRKRLGRSPDDADAVVYWNWVRARRRPALLHDPRQDSTQGYDAGVKLVLRKGMSHPEYIGPEGDLAESWSGGYMGQMPHGL